MHKGGPLLREGLGSVVGYCNRGGESILFCRWLVPCPSSPVAPVGSGSNPGPKFQVASQSSKERWGVMSSSGSSIYSQAFRRLTVEGRPVIRGWTWDSHGSSTLFNGMHFHMFNPL